MSERLSTQQLRVGVLDKTHVKTLEDGTIIETCTIVLGPCPMCGGSGKLVKIPENGFWPEVRCLNPQCPTGFRTGAYRDFEQAVNQWNSGANWFRDGFWRIAQ